MSRSRISLSIQAAAAPRHGTMIQASATLMRSVEHSAIKTNAGRWSIYDGGMMECEIPAYSPKDPDSTTGELLPVYCVVDLATFKALDEAVIALKDHDRDLRCGAWNQIAAQGNELLASLDLAVPSAPESLVHVREIRDLLDIKAPLQASIDARPGPDGAWERITPGAQFSVNGRTFTADATVPTLVLRRGVMKEASIVTFGACENTGRIAAAQSRYPSTQGHPMDKTISERLKAFFAKFTAPAKQAQAAQLIADGKSDAEVSAALEDDEGGEMAELTTRCEAAEKALKIEKAGHDATKAQRTADAAAWEAEKVRMTAAAKEEGRKEGVIQATAKTGAGQAIQFRAPDAPPTGTEVKTITEGMKLIAAEKDNKLKGSELHAEALRRFPTAIRG